MRGAADTVFLLDLADATLLRHGDGLQLEDGRFVRVVAAPEPIVEIEGDPHLLARVAWHIGNRHVPAEILPDRIRIARDHVLEEMIEKLGRQGFPRRGAVRSRRRRLCRGDRPRPRP